MRQPRGRIGVGESAIMSAGRRRRSVWRAGLVAVAALVCVGPSSAAVPGGGAISPEHLVKIAVLSTRADLVSGGEALVQVVLPAGTGPSATRIDLNGGDVTSKFAVRANGQLEGLVTGLVNGPNLLTARLPGGYGAYLTIINHPIGGPAFAGPQIQPWLCQTGASDRQ